MGVVDHQKCLGMPGFGTRTEAPADVPQHHQRRIQVLRHGPFHERRQRSVRNAGQHRAAVDPVRRHDAFQPVQHLLGEGTLAHSFRSQHDRRRAASDPSRWLATASASAPRSRTAGVVDAWTCITVPPVLRRTGWPGLVCGQQPWPVPSGCPHAAWSRSGTGGLRRCGPRLRVPRQSFLLLVPAAACRAITRSRAVSPRRQSSTSASFSASPDCSRRVRWIKRTVARSPDPAAISRATLPCFPGEQFMPKCRGGIRCEQQLLRIAAGRALGIVLAQPGEASLQTGSDIQQLLGRGGVPQPDGTEQAQHGVGPGTAFLIPVGQFTPALHRSPPSPAGSVARTVKWAAVRCSAHDGVAGTVSAVRRCAFGPLPLALQCSGIRCHGADGVQQPARVRDGQLPGCRKQPGSGRGSPSGEGMQHAFADFVQRPAEDFRLLPALLPGPGTPLRCSSAPVTIRTCSIRACASAVSASSRSGWLPVGEHRPQGCGQLKRIGLPVGHPPGNAEPGADHGAETTAVFISAGIHAGKEGSCLPVLSVLGQAPCPGQDQFPLELCCFTPRQSARRSASPGSARRRQGGHA